VGCENQKKKKKKKKKEEEEEDISILLDTMQHLFISDTIGPTYLHHPSTALYLRRARNSFQSVQVSALQSIIR
jgi:hypothetical protein